MQIPKPKKKAKISLEEQARFNHVKARSAYICEYLKNLIGKSCLDPKGLSRKSWLKSTFNIDTLPVPGLGDSYLFLVASKYIKRHRGSSVKHLAGLCLNHEEEFNGSVFRIETMKFDYAWTDKHGIRHKSRITYNYIDLDILSDYLSNFVQD
jgi:hypothetical protein